jgi:integrase
MGRVRIYRGKVVIDYRDADNRRRVEVVKGSFTNVADRRIAAKALLRKRESEVERGVHVALNLRPTLRELWERYEAAKVNLRPSTKRDYDRLAELYLLPMFGDQKVHDMRAEQIERFRSALPNGLPRPVAEAFAGRQLAANPKWSEARAKLQASRKKVGRRTVNKILTLTSSLLDFACKRGWADHNAAEHVEHIRDSASVEGRALDDAVLSPAEIRRLLEATPEGVYRLLVETAILTGARLSELLALRWSDTDLQGKQIYIRRAWRERQYTLPKTRTSTRKIDLPERLVQELRLWRLRCPKTADGTLDLVFANRKGRPLSPTNFSTRIFRPALKRAGITRRIRFHDLRHTHASLQLAQGVDVVRVSRALGHANVSTTLNIYAHAMPRENNGNADKLAEFIYGESKGQNSAPTTEPVVVPFPAAAADRKA